MRQNSRTPSIPPPPRAPWRAVALAVLVLVVPAPEATAAGPCDRGLEAEPTNPFGYRQRGPERCEGLYERPVASGLPPLALVSLTGRLDGLDPASREDLVVTWGGLREGELRLRARALRSDLYYRMDARVPAAPGSWAWSPRLLAQLGLGGRQIGIVAWSGDGEDRVYVPIAVGSGEAADGMDELLPVLVPGRDLRQVFWAVEPVEPAEGEPREGRLAGDDRFLGMAFRLPVEVGGLAPGLYDLEVSATLPGGGTVAERFRFRHPGGPDGGR